MSLVFFTVMGLVFVFAAGWSLTRDISAATAYLVLGIFNIWIGRPA